MCLLPRWHLSPWDTMPGMRPTAGLEVGKALNSVLSASFPPALPCPSIITMRDGELGRLYVPSWGGDLWQSRSGKTRAE